MAGRRRRPAAAAGGAAGGRAPPAARRRARASGATRTHLTHTRASRSHARVHVNPPFITRVPKPSSPRVLCVDPRLATARAHVPSTRVVR
jgi:hypothetical protein